MDCRVGNSCSRFEHNAGDRSHWNMRADPGFVDQHESAVQYVDLTVLEEDHGSAIF
ncbi:Uncharacterised protein [Shigella sonnei]|nr:Uncharacterised protein [Shigella sonnei]